MQLWTNLRYSARSLARRPGLTLTLLLTIALGVGSNAAVAGFVRGLVTRNVPLPGIASLVSLFGRGEQDSFSPLSYDDYLALKSRRDLFETLGAGRESVVGAVVDGRSTVMSVAAITPEFAALLQLSLTNGVIISHQAWQIEFASRDTVRGEVIRIDGEERRVWGIAPEWLEGLYGDTAVDIWMPLDEPSLEGSDRGRTFWTLGRLARGVSIDRAQTALGETRSGADSIAVLPYNGMTPEVASGMRRIGTVLSTAAGAVFFIACANVAIFLLARASARSRETSVRVAIGASRGQLAGQILCDSVLISIGGAACGVLLATWTIGVIPAFLWQQDAEKLVLVPDVPGIVGAAVVCAAITIACGLLPLLEIRHDDPAAVLRRESAGPSKRMQQVRAGLVTAQMMACCVLVIATASLLTGFRTALATSTGQELKGAVLATVSAKHRFDRPDLGLKYYRDIEDAANSVAGITASAFSGMPPGSRPGWQPVRIEPPQLPLRDVTMDVAAFTPKSLDRIVTPPIAGRMFAGRDTPGSCKVAIVNQQAAEELFDGDAVARSIEDPAGQRVEIVGIVAMRRAANDKTPVGPTIFYYPQQAGLPLDRVGPGDFRLPVVPKTRAVLEAHVVSPSYFEQMGLSPVAGRIFSEEGSACGAAVINEEAAQLYFSGNAVGGAVIDRAGRRTEVVGVVHAPRVRAAQRRGGAAIYFPMAQVFLPRMTIILSTNGSRSVDALVTDLQRRLDAVPGAFNSPVVTTLDAHLSKIALAPERIATVLVGASASTALLLGILGLYGALAEAALQRRREIAVRLALGAQAWRVVRQVLTDGARFALVGAAAGTVAALFVTRWLGRVAPGADSPTLWAWLIAPLLLLGIVAVASVLPARQAISADPLTIMQRE